jgi:hypothetical protein
MSVPLGGAGVAAQPGIVTSFTTTSSRQQSHADLPPRRILVPQVLYNLMWRPPPMEVD